MSALSKLPGLFKAYPIPFVALAGLSAGAAAYAVGEPYAGSLTWYATLVVGGAPVVYHTLKGIAKGRFAADIVAMLAIVT
ncbi:MAG: hypothetical protein JRN07_00810, partial [Nitrososphaerota archaeon]|nr:hypothetical protein [Nitrososphaerota archaeon]